MSANQFQKVRTTGAKKCAPDAAARVLSTEPASIPDAAVVSTVSPAEIEEISAGEIDESPTAIPASVTRSIGPMGPPGKDGSTVMGAPVDPDPVFGLNGDFWINTASFDFFERRDGAWNRLGNLRGNAGPPGPQGVQGLRGLPGPAALTATTQATEIVARNYPDNAAAQADGLAPGTLYHTDGVLKIVL